jgi:hypothetical protein
MLRAFVLEQKISSRDYLEENQSKMNLTATPKSTIPSNL